MYIMAIVLKPIYIHIDYPLSIDELNEYSIRHTNWINNTTVDLLPIGDLLPTGDFGLHHLVDLDGVYIYGWLNDSAQFSTEVANALRTVDMTKDILLLFEESNCYMIYRINV
jgi:hypothetical protein